MQIIELSENKFADLDNMATYWYDREHKELHISINGNRILNLKDDEALTLLAIIRKEKIN